jgi:hypothetical protein
MLHTFWVTESAFSRMQDYVTVRESQQLYIIHAMHDIDSLRYVLLIECPDRDATFLRLLED